MDRYIQLDVEIDIDTHPYSFRQTNTWVDNATDQ